MAQMRRYGNIFRLDGTNQLQRNPVPLAADYIQPDERSLTDLIRYARRLSELVRFYNLSGQAVGDWRALFATLEDPSVGEILSSTRLNKLLESRDDWPPHVALLLVFLQLYQLLKQDINELPNRHLRYYYEQVLGLKRRAASPDSVHVVFELAKHAEPTLMKLGTALDGGKDANGNSLVYATTNDLLVGHSAIKSTYRLLLDTDRRGNPRFFIAREPNDIEGASWHTFGSRQLDRDASERYMEEAQIGFAIASPTLLLAEGTRLITLRLQVKGAPEDTAAGHYFSFAMQSELSGEEGWLVPDYFSAHLINNGSDQPTIEITMRVEESSMAIVAADPDVHTGAPPSVWPVARFLLKGDSGHYAVLAGIEIESVAISVQVDGVKKLIVQNEESLLNAEKPIPLFGNQPHVGSAFYVGNDEIFSKRLTSLTFRGDWQDKPADLYDHYKEYFSFTSAALENEFAMSFQFGVDMLYQRRWVPLLYNQTLFDNAVPDHREIAIDLSDQDFLDSQFGENRYHAQPQLSGTTQYQPTSKYGFLRFVLKGPTYGAPYAAEVPFNAFGHKTFAPRYSKLAIESSRDTEADIALPKPAYTPTLANLSVDYQAASEFDIGDIYTADAFYSLDFFGSVEADNEVAARLVPIMDGQAALFIGIENSPVSTTPALLFQLDKGTATASTALTEGDTAWSYLAGKQWTDVASSDVLIDTTLGFQQPGIVSLAVGADASTVHHRMPTDLLWLRAAVDASPNSACRTFAIHDRAALASLQVEDQRLDDYEQHLKGVLKAGTISKLSKRSAAIKKVEQPYDGFAGMGSEADAMFFQSSSERLRHRYRAVTPWDMERLVLNEFPSVFKVKCLPHSDADGNRMVGEVALVIIPDLRNIRTNNPLEPRADAVLMTKIGSFVRALSTTFAKIHIIHPVYERILVDASVTFVSGYDAGYYAALLNEELKRFLTPWAYEEGLDIVFGAQIYRSEILAFIEGREYIDNITRFSLYHSYAGTRRNGIGDLAIEHDLIIYPKPIPAINDMEIGSSFVVGQSVEVAIAASEHAILVSHPEHRINPLPADRQQCAGVDQLGIGYMTVNLDFTVSP